MDIEYYTKNVYGNELNYIKDEVLSELIKKITGQKTLSLSNIQNFKHLGIKFIRVLE